MKLRPCEVRLIQSLMQVMCRWRVRAREKWFPVSNLCFLREITFAKLRPRDGYRLVSVTRTDKIWHKNQDYLANFCQFNFLRGWLLQISDGEGWGKVELGKGNEAQNERGRGFLLCLFPARTLPQVLCHPNLLQRGLGSGAARQSSGAVAHNRVSD